MYFWSTPLTMLNLKFGEGGSLQLIVRSYLGLETQKKTRVVHLESKVKVLEMISNVTQSFFLSF